MRKWLSILVVVMAVAAVVAAGCGGSDDKGNGGGDGGNGDMSAQEIMTASQKAMNGIKTAAFDMDVTLAIKGDASKMTDPQAKQLLSSPISVKAAGKIGNEPQKMDMTVKADAMGQAFDLGMKMDGETVYLQYMGTWYAIPKDMAEGITGASPAPDSAETQKLTDAYKQLGIDPDTWASGYTIEGEEDVNGVATYHISQQIDIDKVATDISKLAGSASGLGSIAGGETGSDPEEMQQTIDMLKAGVKDVKVEYWVGKDDSYIHKMQASAMLDVAALPESERQGAEGLESVDFSMTMNMSDYDQDFAVEAPADAKPFDQLFNDLMQSGGLNL